MGDDITQDQLNEMLRGSIEEHISKLEIKINSYERRKIFRIAARLRKDNRRFFSRISRSKRSRVFRRMTININFLNSFQKAGK